MLLAEQQQLVSKSCNSGQQPALIGGAEEAEMPHAPSLTDGCCIDIKTNMSKLWLIKYVKIMIDKKYDWWIS